MCSQVSHEEQGRKQFKEAWLTPWERLARLYWEGRTRNSGKKEVTCFVSQPEILSIWFGMYPVYTSWLRIKQNQHPQQARARQ